MRARSGRFISLAVLALGAALLTPVGGYADDKDDRAKPTPGPSYKDPRSGAALNREAALRPHHQPPPIYADDPRTQVLQGAVNNPGADATAQDTQSETSIAAIGNKVSVAWNDSGSFIGGANRFTGYGFSDNGGLSFTDRGSLPPSGEGDAGDPVLAADTSFNTVYLSTLGFTTGENIQVFKSVDGGSTYGAPVNGTPGYGGSGAFQDKEWMTVDNFPGTGRHNVYLCWTKFAPNGEIRFTRSTDTGATFTPNLGLLLSPGGQGCYVVVGPDHSVYVFYYRGTGSGGQGGDNKLFVRKSTDRGASFAPEVEVADLLTTTVNGNLGLGSGARSNSFPHAAVNPVNGHLYVVYNDNPGDADNADSFYRRSTNGGATWSAPVQVNNDDAGREQYFPTVGVSTNGSSVMFGYYSNVNDSTLRVFHRRGRLGLVNPTTGAVTLKPSFQLSPDTPAVIGQDPVINATYMGDYDQITATTGFFHTSWSDNRDGNTFHRNQPDVFYGKIKATPASTNPAVTVTAPANADLGSNVNIRATVTNPGANRAEDVFVTVTLPTGLVPKAVVPSGGGRCTTFGQLAECYMAGVGTGSSKTIDITAFATTAGTKTTKATLTTSGSDTNASNNTATAATSVTGTGTSNTYSTGNIAVPIADVATTDVPIAVPDDGAILTVSARVRLNHTFDGDLDLFLISPASTVVELSTDNGGSGDNYGSGANDCSGTKTVFFDTAATSITAGAAPFAGSFKPESPQGVNASDNPQGGWKLRIVDDAGGDVGTVGCFQLVISRIP